ncbi:hypothetical protein [Halorussus aquaticus]|uniref:Uncharacterized protein n=1 Tax=Halorussus aquaticus TaxID=2953748 RepID=A0ABD5PY58_9EURY|nr:hypothetical protein [Halorussus aquaticus]
MGKDPHEPRRTGGSHDRFQEHRIHRSHESVLDTTVGDLARVDDGLDDLVGRQA